MSAGGALPVIAYDANGQVIEVGDWIFAHKGTCRGCYGHVRGIYASPSGGPRLKVNFERRASQRVYSELTRKLPRYAVVVIDVGL